MINGCGGFGVRCCWINGVEVVGGWECEYDGLLMGWRIYDEGVRVVSFGCEWEM